MAATIQGSNKHPVREEFSTKPGFDHSGEFIGFSNGDDASFHGDAAAIVSAYPEWTGWPIVFTVDTVKIAANDPTKFAEDMVDDIITTVQGGSVVRPDGSQPVWLVLSHSLVNDPVLDVFTHTRMKSTRVEGLEVVYKHYH